MEGYSDYMLSLVRTINVLDRILRFKLRCTLHTESVDRQIFIGERAKGFLHPIIRCYFINFQHEHVVDCFFDEAKPALQYAPLDAYKALVERLKRTPSLLESLSVRIWAEPKETQRLIDSLYDAESFALFELEWMASEPKVGIE